MGQAFWPPSGPSLSGSTPRVTRLRSGLQSRPTLPAPGSLLSTVFLCICYPQQLFLILPRQLPASAAPTRRSAILAHGSPPPMPTCSHSEHASTHASIRHRSWLRAQACQQRSNSNWLRRSPAADRMRDCTAPIPAAFQPVQGPPPRQPAGPTAQATGLGPGHRSVVLLSACTPASHAIRYPTVLHVPSRNMTEKKTKRKCLTIAATTLPIAVRTAPTLAPNNLHRRSDLRQRTRPSRLRRA